MADFLIEIKGSQCPFSLNGIMNLLHADSFPGYMVLELEFYNLINAIDQLSWL